MIQWKAWNAISGRGRVGSLSCGASQMKTRLIRVPQPRDQTAASQRTERQRGPRWRFRMEFILLSLPTRMATANGLDPHSSRWRRTGIRSAAVFLLFYFLINDFSRIRQRPCNEWLSQQIHRLPLNFFQKISNAPIFPPSTVDWTRDGRWLPWQRLWNVFIFVGIESRLSVKWWHAHSVAATEGWTRLEVGVWMNGRPRLLLQCHLCWTG